MNLIKDGKQKEVDGDHVFKVKVEIQSNAERVENFEFNLDMVKTIWENNEKKFNGILNELA